MTALPCFIFDKERSRDERARNIPERLLLRNKIFHSLSTINAINQYISLRKEHSSNGLLRKDNLQGHPPLVTCQMSQPKVAQKIACFDIRTRPRRTDGTLRHCVNTWPNLPRMELTGIMWVTGLSIGSTPRKTGLASKLYQADSSNCPCQPGLVSV